jgi:hypothetical protein
MRIKEWHRTVILLVLLAIAVGYIVYLKTGYESNLENILQ